MDATRAPKKGVVSVPKLPSEMVAVAIERVNSAVLHLMAAQTGEMLATFEALTAMSAAQELLKKVHHAGAADTRQAQEVLFSGMATCKRQTTSHTALHEVEMNMRRMLPVMRATYEQLKRMEQDVEDVTEFLDLLPDVSPGSADQASM